ncbi:MAG TPA: phage major capsid protein [Chryseosolibacter sp.]
MKRLTDLRQDIAQKEKRMKEIFDLAQKENRARTDAEKTEWNNLKKDVDSFKDELRDLEEQDRINRANATVVKPSGEVENSENVEHGYNFKEARSGKVVNAPTFTIYERSTPKSKSISDWYQRNFDVDKDAAAVHPGALVRAFFSGPKNDVEERALSIGTNSAGGYTVPVITAAKIIDNVRAKSTLFQAGATTYVMDDSGRHTMAKVTADPTAAWVAENASITSSDPTFDAVQFNAKKVVAHTYLSGELMQDGINIDDALFASLTGSLGSEIDRAGLVGSGSGQEPKGIFNYSSPSLYSMGTNGAHLDNYDPFIDCIQEMLENNCEIPTHAIYAPRTWATAAKLKDANNASLALPDALKNIKWLQSSKIPVNQTQGSASDASPVFLGGFQNLYAGIRLNIQIIPATDKVGTNYQFGFLAVARMDWQPRREADFGLIKGIKVS